MQNNKSGLANIFNKFINCLKVLSISVAIGIELLISVYLFIPVNWLNKINNESDIKIFLIIYISIFAVCSILVNKNSQYAYITMNFVFSYLIIYAVGYTGLILAYNLHFISHYSKFWLALWILIIEIIAVWKSYKHELKLINGIVTVTFYSILMLLIALFVACIYIDLIELSNPIRLVIECIILIIGGILILFGKFKDVWNIIDNTSKKFNGEIINILSIGFSYIFIFAIIASFSKWDSNQEWISILGLSIIIILLLLIFGPEIKNWEFGSFYIIYFLVVSIVPILICFVFLTREQLGSYSLFKVLTFLIILIGALALETLGSSDIKDAYLDDAHKVDKSKLAKVRLFVVNLTALVTFENSIFANQSGIIKFCSIFSNLCKKVNLIQVPEALSSTQYKIAIFIILSNIIVFISSFILIKLEKHIFLKFTMHIGGI
ncbi:hypothetical protein [Lactobacillus sp. PSON]|uniref:hypothetical protein n=1 Tax=Lactobacillus sp. PSON TaxID=3455454 RepID=UPI004042C2F8